MEAAYAVEIPQVADWLDMLWFAREAHGDVLSGALSQIPIGGHVELACTLLLTLERGGLIERLRAEPSESQVFLGAGGRPAGTRPRDALCAHPCEVVWGAVDRGWLTRRMELRYGSGGDT